MYNMEVFEPPREMKIWEIGGNITAFGWGGFKKLRVWEIRIHCSNILTIFSDMKALSGK